MFLFFSGVLSSCGLFIADTFKVIGSQYSYQVPRELKNKTGFAEWLYGGEISGADKGSGEELLNINSKKLEKFPYDSPLLIWFRWSRDYSINNDLSIFANSYLSESHRKAKSKEEGYYYYYDSLFDDKIYLNFSPNNLEQAALSKNKILVIVSQEKPFTIAGKTTVPKKTCDFHTRIDGMSVEFSINGSPCAIEKFGDIHQYVRGLFKQWQVDKN